ncbi:DUF2789 domain-containing protein [Acinetobacter sp. ANC 5579]|uniref:DUF2789 family protein n=1 Tax=Acinetobacter TaxID=469 RepID=UPI000992C477|nr:MULTISPECIES: DUF2789 family protein [Acinetobacter]MCL6232408.1 DUF2789 domain-containing protein [Acinetobacter amyesii]MCL6236464.1 DUF2789 domain-containing protein [Acinetobacter amyesii]MCL6239851.1 DUF2789 domain-containing protein [Acinetobacter amyesii]MCL6240487.1 DUF2789 domain-containing protein [Acinetobacter amyesii]MCL6244330.1 DUF2789 domain-containing protein [Acinetobacter amyesii]
MFDQQPTLELFFEQLGLDASPEGIDQFIETHQITMDVPLHEAPFWTKSQRDFIISHWKKDDDWAIVVDILNEQLHTEHKLSGSCKI